MYGSQTDFCEFPTPQECIAIKYSTPLGAALPSFAQSTFPCTHAARFHVKSSKSNFYTIHSRKSEVYMIKII